MDEDIHSNRWAPQASDTTQFKEETRWNQSKHTIIFKIHVIHKPNNTQTNFGQKMNNGHKFHSWE